MIESILGGAHCFAFSIHWQKTDKTELVQFVRLAKWFRSHGRYLIEIKQKPFTIKYSIHLVCRIHSADMYHTTIVTFEQYPKTIPLLFSFCFRPKQLVDKKGHGILEVTTFFT